MPEPTDVPEIMITTSTVEAGTADTAPPDVTPDPLDSVDDQVLVSLIGKSVLAVDGVARLEPTVKSLFRAGIGTSRGADRPDGIAVTSFGAITEITVDLATTARHRSREVAESVQHIVREVLEAHGREAGRISVNVLSIDQHPSSAD